MQDRGSIFIEIKNDCRQEKYIELEGRGNIVNEIKTNGRRQRKHTEWIEKNVRREHWRKYMNP